VHRLDDHREAQRALARRLRARQADIEEAAYARISAQLSSRLEREDADCVSGLRLAFADALDYGLDAVEYGAESLREVPSALIAQARGAARSGLGLDTLLRRYVAGDRVLAEFVSYEAAQLPVRVHQSVMRAQAEALDQLMAAASEEHANELEIARNSPGQRNAKLVRRLLNGDHVDLDAFKYVFDGWHLGLTAVGGDAMKVVQRLAERLERDVLAVPAGEGMVWAWLGGRRHLAAADVERAARILAGTKVSIALGEPLRGLAGWRLTHRQAQAARLVSLANREQITRYADVVLLAAALRDDTTAQSLYAVYLAPLNDQRDGGRGWRETLSAYLAAGQNASSAASALGVARHTVENRLRKIEALLPHAIHTCQAELAVALRLEALTDEREADGRARLRMWNEVSVALAS
jgi:hypothetical protein